jgi:glutaredoxin
MTRQASPSSSPTARRIAWLGGLLLALGGLSSPAWALYKVVGPDGKVTYTDRAPANQAAQALKANGSVTSTDTLPYELQKVVSRYPVVLFSSQVCAPCDAGRQLLKARGVPFTEKSVSTPEDAKALQRTEGTEQLPVLRIGSKQLLGYSATDWTSYLDAAGYPAKSVLPLNHRWATATPLAPVAVKVPPASGSSEAESTPQPSHAAPTAPAGSTPPGFRF